MKKLFLLMFVGSFLLMGCSTGGHLGGGPLEHWENFNNNNYNALSDIKINKNQSRLILMRDTKSINGPAINVFIDGDYAASLLAGGYYATAVCSRNNRLLSSFSSNKRFADKSKGVDYHFVSGETVYMKVVEDMTGQPVFQIEPVQQAQLLLSQLKKVTQTLPRTKVRNDCGKVVLDKLTLRLRSLFEFDKSDYSDMLPEDKKSLLDFIRKANEKAEFVKSIKVTGYTDPMGSASYNLALSKKRADTVKKVLQTNGVVAEIVSEGLGEANLVVDSCARKFKGEKAEKIACNKINRRVEVVLYGESK